VLFWQPCVGFNIIRGIGAGAAIWPQFVVSLGMLTRHQCVLDMAQSEWQYCLFFVCHQIYDGAVCLAAAFCCTCSSSSCHFIILISSTSAAAAKLPQFIFGLDMLKRHQCVLDMAQSECHYSLLCVPPEYDGAVCLAAAFCCAYSSSLCHKIIVISSTSAAAARLA
jgi:hypothetical protein